jgi:hypothetical protein
VDLTCLLVITITCGDGLRNFLLRKDKVQPLSHKLKRSQDKTCARGSHTYRQIGFVGVYLCIHVWDERRVSASREERARSGKRDSQRKLHIQVGLYSSTTLVILPTCTPKTASYELLN